MHKIVQYHLYFMHRNIGKGFLADCFVLNAAQIQTLSELFNGVQRSTVNGWSC